MGEVEGEGSAAKRIGGAAARGVGATRVGEMRGPPIHLMRNRRLTAHAPL
jgi:hypothetical protein